MSNPKSFESVVENHLFNSKYNIDIPQASRREDLEKKEENEELQEDLPKYETREETVVTRTSRMIKDEVDEEQEQLQNFESDTNSPQLLRGQNVDNKKEEENLVEDEVRREGVDIYDTKEKRRVSRKLVKNPNDASTEHTSSPNSEFRSTTSAALHIEHDRGLDITSQQNSSKFRSAEEREGGSNILDEIEMSHQLSHQASVASIDDVDDDHDSHESHESHELHGEADEDCCRFEEHTHEDRCVACREGPSREWTKKHSYLRKGQGGAQRYGEALQITSHESIPHETEDDPSEKSQSTMAARHSHEGTMTDKNNFDELHKKSMFSYNVKDVNFVDRFDESESDDQMIDKTVVDLSGDFHHREGNSSSDEDDDEQNSSTYLVEDMEEGTSNAGSHAVRHSKTKVAQKLEKRTIPPETGFEEGDSPFHLREVEEEESSNAVSFLGRPPKKLRSSRLLAQKLEKRITPDESGQDHFPRQSSHSSRFTLLTPGL